jgi:hypothetical protein
MVGDASWSLVHIFRRLHPIYVIKHWLVSQSMKEIFKDISTAQTTRLASFGPVFVASAFHHSLHRVFVHVVSSEKKS